MLLKDNIINYVAIVGIVKGIAEGFYHFPKNILGIEKVSNEERQKYNGILSTINKISSIIVPLILGVLLTYISYTNLGKIFFLLFIVMFILSFYLEDVEYHDKKFELKKFFEKIRINKDIRNTLIVYLMSGFTYSSGVMATIVTLSKINIFKTNLNLGYVDSVCAFIYLIVCILFTAKIKKKDFKNIILISGVISFITLVIFAFKPSIPILVAYLLVRNSLVGFINLISDNITINISNSKGLKENFKAEYYFTRFILCNN